MAEYIELEALLADIDAAMDNSRMGYVVRQTLKRYVKRQPTADVVEVKRGRWISHNKGMNNWVECSECNTVGSPFWKGCPVCLARMDGDGNG